MASWLLSFFACCGGLCRKCFANRRELECHSWPWLYWEVFFRFGRIYAKDSITKCCAPSCECYSWCWKWWRQIEEEGSHPDCCHSCCWVFEFFWKQREFIYNSCAMGFLRIVFENLIGSEGWPILILLCYFVYQRSRLQLELVVLTHGFSVRWWVVKEYYTLYVEQYLHFVDDVRFAYLDGDDVGLEKEDMIVSLTGCPVVSRKIRNMTIFCLSCLCMEHVALAAPHGEIWVIRWSWGRSWSVWDHQAWSKSLVVKLYRIWIIYWCCISHRVFAGFGEFCWVNYGAWL